VTNISPIPPRASNMCPVGRTIGHFHHIVSTQDHQVGPVFSIIEVDGFANLWGPSVL
jgi:hypothetical protein